MSWKLQAAHFSKLHLENKFLHGTCDQDVAVDTKLLIGDTSADLNPYLSIT
jgi:hypothetical protein